jgi:hypothetical protein
MRELRPEGLSMYFKERLVKWRVSIAARMRELATNPSSAGRPSRKRKAITELRMVVNEYRPLKRSKDPPLDP